VRFILPFQFFPSCFASASSAGRPNPSELSILSQLLRKLGRGHRRKRRLCSCPSFQFFPSCFKT
jgi:hypothetical protein